MYMYTTIAIDNQTGEEFSFGADTIEALAAEVKAASEGHDFPSRLKVEGRLGVCGWVSPDGGWAWGS